jgi:8-oxo-dGTP diphosphatase
MAGRTASGSRSAPSVAVSIDIVLIGCHERRLCILAQPTAPTRRLALPWGATRRGEHMDAAAARIARDAIGVVPDWLEQVGAFGDGTPHPGNAALSVCFAGVLPWVDAPSWKDAHALAGLAERQRRMVAAALTVVRSRLEQSPIAFFLLPREFTLSELQQAYETILGRRLHKASFRRSLQAAFVVEPTGEWRGEGRGRPAQLYRFVPRRRKSARRGVRLDLL